MRETPLRVMLTLLLLPTLVIALNPPLVKSGPGLESEGTVVRTIPGVIELEGDVVGQTFTIAVVVENVSDLQGLDIIFEFNTTYLQYVNHIQTAPVESFPDPIPPSPYPGIIHWPLLTLPVEPEPWTGRYWAAFATLGGPSFNGSGTVFVMTFQVQKQPQPHEEDITLTLSLSNVDLASTFGAIPHTVVNGTVILHKLSTYELHITSLPLTGIPFTFDGAPRVTPYHDSLIQGSYTLKMPKTYNEYNWSHWLEDGDTSRTKMIALDGNALWTGVYSKTPPSPPIGGVSTPIDSKLFLPWLTSTILIISFIFTTNIYFRKALRKIPAT